MQQLISDHNLISDHPSGFPPNRSRGTALVEVTEPWKKTMDLGKITVAVFIDLREKFDSLPGYTVEKTCDNRIDRIYHELVLFLSGGKQSMHTRISLYVCIFAAHFAVFYRGPWNSKASSFIKFTKRCGDKNINSFRNRNSKNRQENENFS